MLCQGSEVYGIGTIEKLYARGAPGMRFVCYGPGALHDWLREHGLPTERIEGLSRFNPSGSPSTLLRFPRAWILARRTARRTHEVLKSHGITTLHTHWLPQQLIAGHMRSAGYRAVWQINNNMTPSRLFGLGRRLNHALARWGADLLLPASDFVSRNWEGCGVPRVIIRNAAVARYPTWNALPEAPVRCLTAGRLVASKGHHVALEAVLAARQAGHDVRLDIFGGPLENNPYADRLRGAIAAARADEAIRLMGFRDDLRDLHQQYHLGLQCRIDPEPCSLWVCEAMVDGLPLVASAGGGTPELVEDGVTGLLYAPGNPAEMADRILALAAQPERLAAMRRASFERGARAFTLERFVTETIEAYATLRSTA